jgi:cell wall-associated NlpC family hydrolase
MTAMKERAAVLTEARSWLGTPYRHMGRAKGKGGGVDCAQLVYLVYHARGLVEDIPLESYPRDFMLHRGAERYLDAVTTHAHETTEPAPGDVVLFRIGRLYAHGAIIDEPGWPRIIHAWYQARAVIADWGDRGQLGARPHRFFSVQPALVAATPSAPPNRLPAGSGRASGGQSAGAELLARAGLVGGRPREED